MRLFAERATKGGLFPAHIFLNFFKTKALKIRKVKIERLEEVFGTPEIIGIDILEEILRHALQKD